ncbi:hypothetical protein [Geoalkalibacter subterraneus]|uniref:hypothetical protein n=1 Tax=Geoalkalibacter subterraneus TaxID=483547 RepID=UPI0006934ADE|nr:hypothetical protein [Geoalkalibacter subterraneus]
METSDPYFEQSLNNGLIVEVQDLTHRYYGDYHKVTLDVTLRVPLVGGLFSDQDHPGEALEKARRILGDEARSVQRLERMGVPSDMVETIRTRLWESYQRSSFGYFQRPDYPAKLVRQLLDKRKKTRPFLQPVS